MKRRDFLTVAAGIGAGSMLAGVAGSAPAKDKPSQDRSQIYKCEDCGAIVEVLVPGKSPPAHCEKPMKLLVEQSEGELAPKHVPVIEKLIAGYKVKVGSVVHPMLKTHYIVWIDLIADGRLYRQFLQVGGPPEAVFPLEAKQVAARAYCNLHGLWKSK